jgi:hypothetical protein
VYGQGKCACIFVKEISERPAKTGLVLGTVT